jgi:hypothetical protein
MGGLEERPQHCRKYRPLIERAIRGRWTSCSYEAIMRCRQRDRGEVIRTLTEVLLFFFELMKASPASTVT